MKKQHGILFNAEMIRAYFAGLKGQTRRVASRRNCRAVTQSGKLLMLSQDEWDSLSFDHAVIKDGQIIVPNDIGGVHVLAPIWSAGDVLWGRETHYVNHTGSFIAGMLNAEPQDKIIYRATYDKPAGFKWKPSLLMKREHSRLVTPILSVRAERLQDISEADAIAEGCMAQSETPYDYWQGYDNRMEDKAGNTLHHSMVPKEFWPEPPPWMEEVKTHKGTRGFSITARRQYQTLWNSINGPDSWNQNPLVWVIEFTKHQPASPAP